MDESAMKPWNLTQVSVENKEEFKDCLLRIMKEGRKLTPFEIVKLEYFLKAL